MLIEKPVLFKIQNLKECFPKFGRGNITNQQYCRTS